MNIVVAYNNTGTGDASDSSEAIHSRPVAHDSPILSLSESTPTHTDCTEGTPSFTMSSPSCSSDILGTPFSFLLTLPQLHVKSSGAKRVMRQNKTSVFYQFL